MSVTAFFPREILKEIDIFHVPSADGPGSYPGTADVTVTGAILPLSSQRRATIGVDEVGSFELFLDDDVDAREGDKIIVDPDGDALEYRIFNVDTYDFGGLPHKDCIITKMEA